MKRFLSVAFITIILCVTGCGNNGSASSGAIPTAKEEIATNIAQASQEPSKESEVSEGEKNQVEETPDTEKATDQTESDKPNITSPDAAEGEAAEKNAKTEDLEAKESNPPELTETNLTPKPTESDSKENEPANIEPTPPGATTSPEPTPEPVPSETPSLAEAPDLKPTTTPVPTEAPKLEPATAPAPPETPKLEPVAESVVEKSTASEVSASDMVFNINGIAIKTGNDINPIINSLGNDYAFSEAVSCDHDGMDKVFTYSGVELYTFPDGDKDVINEVIIISPAYKTERGLSVSSTKADVIATYGDNYQEFGSTIKYSAGGNNLFFYMNGNTVDSISLSR